MTPPSTVSATKAKHNFGAMMNKVKGGTPIIIEKNNSPEIVWISIDDYEDFLELKDKNFQKTVAVAKKEIKKGNFGTLDSLYKIHRKTIIRESN